MIDDDVELGDAMRPALEKYGISLTHAETPSTGFEILRKEIPDVVLLDMMLPGMDGMMVCREIRLSDAAWRDVPIVALSARAELTDRIVGLESGIDDYIAKPVEMRELVARLRAVSRPSRRVVRPSEQPALTLDRERLEAGFGGVRVQVTALEIEVLGALQAAAGAVLSRSEIYARIGHGTRSDPAMIDTVIYRIRQKFRAEGSHRDFILTVRGVGYSIPGGAHS